MKRETIDPALLEEVKRCSEFVKQGKSLLYPADSIWGLGCDAGNKEAIEEIKVIKSRPEEKSFITLVSSYRMLQKVVKSIPSAAEDLIEVSDKAITIVYPSSTESYRHLTSEKGEIAVRMINSGFAHMLMERSGRPLISTSANLSGQKTGMDLTEIDEEIKSKVDCIVKDDFDFELTGSPSSVIRIGEKGEIEILR